MGADIHVFLEYDITEQQPGLRRVQPRIHPWPPAFGDPQWIHAFAEGEISLPRDYRLFSALAGVRAGSHDLPPLVPPRGFPVHAHRSTVSWFYRYVRDLDETDTSMFEEMTRENAEDCVARGVSHFRDHYTKARGFVSDPG